MVVHFPAANFSYMFKHLSMSIYGDFPRSPLSPSTSYLPLDVVQEAICSLLFKVEAVVPYSRGDLLSRVHELGACDSEEFTDAGTFIKVM